MNICLRSPNLSQLLSEIKYQLDRHKIASPITEAEQIITHFLNISRSQIYLDPEFPITSDQLVLLTDTVAKRCDHVPLQYLLGKVEFCDVVLNVTPEVLIPRPETEFLVELILEENSGKDLSICDIGTGSGAIAIALKKARPSWQITAADISLPALEIAAKNAELNNCWIEFVQSDIFSSINKKFDLIVSNPPYISDSDYQELEPELFHEPQIALTAPENGLYFYRNIIKSITDYLDLSGVLYLEIGAGQSQDIALLAEKYGAKEIITRQDYNNFDRYMTIKFS